MAKVTINGEVYDYDPALRPMTEILAIEEGLGCTWTEWEVDLQKGSAKALCGMVWSVLHRNGRAVTIKDLLDGTFEVNLADFKVEQNEGDADPTNPGPDPSRSTAAGTSARSRKSSG